MRSVIAPVEKIGESRKPVAIDDDSDDTDQEGVPKETPQDQSIEEKEEGDDKQEDEEKERKEEKEEGDKKEDEGKDENPKEATED